MDMVYIFGGLLLLGCVIGFLAGLLGIGGGLLTVPFLTMVLSHLMPSSEHLVHMAIGTAAATIVFTSFASLRAHYKRDAIFWPVWRAIVPGLLIGGMLGAQIAGFMPMLPLAIVFAVFTTVSATQMLLGKSPKASRHLPGKTGLVAAGTFIGTVSGLIGGGGGFLSVPYFIWNNMPVRNAVATSAAMGFPIALASSLGFVMAGWSVAGRPEYSLGYVYLPAMVAIVLTSMIFAPLGVRAAHHWPVATLRRCFACLLYCLGAYMVWKVL